MQEMIEELKNIVRLIPETIRIRYGINMDDLDSFNQLGPFNNIELMINKLVASGLITYQNSCDIRTRFYARNPYLNLFGITSPRGFGETWAQQHLNSIVPELTPPTREIDPFYSGQYDFWYDGIRIEVKASRAVLKMSGGTLVEKALKSDSPEPFAMNFQQLKPSCCDVFVLIAVWLDTIRYWVLSSRDVESNQNYSSSQHRGNEGEGQLWIRNNNILEFFPYEVDKSDIRQRIIDKYYEMHPLPPPPMM